MELYGVEGAPPHQHILITGSAAASLGTGEGQELDTSALNIYEDDNKTPYVKPNESLESIKLDSGTYTLIFDTLRNVLSQIFGISEKESKENYPFIIKNISPSRKEVRLVLEGDENINLEQLKVKMPQIVGVVDDTRANDEEGNLIQNGINMESSVSEIHGIPVGGQFLGTDDASIVLNNNYQANLIEPGALTINGTSSTETDSDGNPQQLWPTNGFDFITGEAIDQNMINVYGYLINTNLQHSLVLDIETEEYD